MLTEHTEKDISPVHLVLEEKTGRKLSVNRVNWLLLVQGSLFSKAYHPLAQQYFSTGLVWSLPWVGVGVPLPLPLLWGGVLFHHHFWGVPYSTTTSGGGVLFHHHSWGGVLFHYHFWGGSSSTTTSGGGGPLPLSLWGDPMWPIP